MTPEMNERLSRQLLRDEGLRLKPYRDSVGKLTIGAGRNLDDRGITLAEALYLLNNDIQAVEREVRAAWPWVAELDEARQGVVFNMAFNLGTAGLAGFRKMLAALQARDYPSAAREMIESRWAQQVGPRAQRLAEQMTSGEWR